MAAGQAREIADAEGCRVVVCDAQGRARWHEVWEGNPFVARPEDIAPGEAVAFVQNGPKCRPYIDYRATVADKWRRWHFGRWRARDHVGGIFLSLAESTRGDAVRAAGPFMVIEPHVNPLNKAAARDNKDWGFGRWQALIEAVPQLRWVQMGPAGMRALDGVERVVTASFREACGVLARATAYVGPEGGLHHAAAANGVRGVVLFGGWASVENTGYPPLHVCIADDGPESPCGMLEPCGHCRAAWAGISVDRVAAAVGEVACQ